MVYHRRRTRADPGCVWGGGGPAPFRPGAPTLHKEEKITSRRCSRMQQVLVVNNYPDPLFPKSCIQFDAVRYRGHAFLCSLKEVFVNICHGRTVMLIAISIGPATQYDGMLHLGRFWCLLLEASQIIAVHPTCLFRNRSSVASVLLTM